MNCDQFSEDYELYALGLLEAPEKDAFEKHLAGNCENCRSQIEKAIQLNGIISATVSRREASADLRRRILQTFAHTPSRDIARRPVPIGWMLGLAAAAILILVLSAGLFFEHHRRVLEGTRAKADAAELARIATAVHVLQSPGVKRVSFGPQPATPHGSLFVNEELGIVLVAGGLPTPPRGFRYESWIVPKSGVPKPIEPFQAASGGAIRLIPGPLDIAKIKAVAVSLEPDNVPAITPTKVIFAAPLGN